MKKGFTLIEIVVGSAVFLTVAIAAYGAYAGVFKLASLNQVRIIAVGLANEQFEVIRNMPYSQIGIVNGIPQGILPASTTVIRAGATFNVGYTIRDVDLPFDGTFGSTTANDSAPADSKFIQVAISCPTCQNFVPVIVSGQVAPKNLENSTNNGALFVQVIDANYQPVSGASVHVAYTATTSPIIVDDTTNNSGMLSLVNIPPAVQAYAITVNKSGYTSDQTYVASSSNPSPYKPASTVVAQQLTQITFSIDKTSVLNINSMTPLCVPVPNFDFNLVGSSKLIGPGVPKYSRSLVTNGAGSLVLNQFEWDSYTITPTDTSYDLAGLNPLNPISLSSNSVQNLQLIVVPRNSRSILITVKDQTTGLPLSGATVRVAGPSSYDETQMTGQGYFNQTDWSDGATQPGIFSNVNAYANGGGIFVSTSSNHFVQLLANSGGLYSTNSTGTLDSSIFDTGTTSAFSLLSWAPNTQSPLTGASSVKFQFAISQSQTLSTWNFLGPDGTADTYYTAPNSSISSGIAGQYARYRMYLTTQTATVTPIVSGTSFTYTSGCIPPGQVIFSGLQSSATYTVDISAPNYNSFNISTTTTSAWVEIQAPLQKLP